MIALGMRMTISAERRSWWEGGVIYQIYPRSFQDSNGDGVGDLEGIRLRLEYIVSLGVDAVWLSPIFPSPMADFGYDVSDYCNVAEMFGNLADFDALLTEVQAHGVFNRTLVGICSAFVAMDVKVTSASRTTTPIT
jgi:1,4-alpha-glucan branching enzyme